MRLPSIIDVEASGFGVESYPIEVGVVLHDGAEYCALIRPPADWTYWDRQAEAVHGIARETLEADGRPIFEVAGQLNQLLDGRTVYCDGWVVDKPWLTTLFARAQIEMRFRISPLETILSEVQMASWHRTKAEVEAEAVRRRHRAGADARIVRETYRRTREV